jgi:hypothetical protein
MQERQVGGLLAAAQLFGRQIEQPLVERQVTRTRHAFAVEHLVIGRVKMIIGKRRRQAKASAGIETRHCFFPNGDARRMRPIIRVAAMNVKPSNYERLERSLAAGASAAPLIPVVSCGWRRTWSGGKRRYCAGNPHTLGLF